MAQRNVVTRFCRALVFSFLILELLLPRVQCFPLGKSPRSVPEVSKRLESYPFSFAGSELDPPKIEERQSGSYWYESAQHGISSFGPRGYQVFRNVKDYGARGDGSTDDTDAINRAITDGGRCGQTCGSSTTTPAVVYFPSGTYVVSKPLIQYYNTQFVGNPNAIPTLRAAPTFAGIAVIDSDVYIPGASGAEWYIPQSNFYRQIRNFIIDISACPNKTPDGFAPTGIHWQVAQATSLQNLKFVMSQAPGTTHIGIFMENGSGGYLGDLSFVGGAIGMRCGSQQFTSRNLNFQFCSTAIEMIWDWGWTWKGLNIFQSWIGINITALSSATALHRQGVAAIAVLDSVMTNVPIGILTGGTTNTMIENLQLNNVPIAVGFSGGPTVLQGGNVLIDNYGNGNNFVMSGTTLTPGVLHGPYKPSAKSAASSTLRDSTGWFARSKPQYETSAIGAFKNVKQAGAKGDGMSDDTAVINAVLAAAAGKSIVYFPHGSYIVTDTIHVPPGTKMVGEAWSEIMGMGNNFADITKPRVMVQVGTAGQSGIVEISDMLFTVTGPTAGAILMEWNIAESSQGSAGMWDAHFRVGGAAGSQLQYSNCPREDSLVNTGCIAATMLMHVTSSASGYFENVWVWVADHDLDIPSQNQVSIYAARCLLIESTRPVWLWGTAAEHCTMYQYHFYQAQNIFAATLQTETPYYQPIPKAPAPFQGAYARTSDPTFSYCDIESTTCAYAWGLEIIASKNMMIYGAGFYSWFQWYSQVCLDGEICQERVVRVFDSTNIFFANLYTKGSSSMIQGGQTADIWAIDNMDGFLGTIVGWTGLSLPGKLDTPSNLIPLPPWIWDVPNPTVSCIIPCTILPPPTPILPIKPPPFSTTISGTVVTVTPPPITSPGLEVSPIPIVQPGPVTVTPVIVPNPVVTVPPVPPHDDNTPGGGPPILPPPIPMPLPPPVPCFQFCGPPFPPILPPIVVVNGPPIPVGAPPPLIGDPDDPDEDPEDETEKDCIPGIPQGIGDSWPAPSNVPTWGQSPIGTKCDWSGSVVHLQNTLTISVAPGASTFTFNAFAIMHVGPSNGISMSGATMQVYAPGVSSWSTVNSPKSTGATSSNNYITLDVPRNPLASEISVTGTLSQSVSQIQVQIIFEASTVCGGNGIPNPGGNSGGGGGGGPVPPEHPSKADGTIDCSGTRSDGAGTVNMLDCLWPFGSIVVQGQTLAESSSISSENVNGNCIRSGVSKVGDVITNSWCIVYQNAGCAFVISDKYHLFGACFPEHSVISGGTFRNMAIAGAQQCAGKGRTAIAAGPFQPCNWPAQTLCLTNPAHPEVCGVA